VYQHEMHRALSIIRLSTAEWVASSVTLGGGGKTVCVLLLIQTNNHKLNTKHRDLHICPTNSTSWRY